MRAAALRGHRAGLAFPVLQLVCRAEKLPAGMPAPALTADEDRCLAPLAAEWPLRRPRAAAASDPVEALCLARFAPLNALLLRLQRSAGWPIGGGGLLEEFADTTDPQAGTQALISWPLLDPAAMVQALPWLAWVLGDGAAPAAAAPAAPGGARPDLSRVLAGLARVAPPGFNTRVLLEAAARRGIPGLMLPGRITQFGWGARRRWIDSSFTDRDSMAGARLARDKAAAQALMRHAGLPVPQQAVVHTADEACAAAARFGYPAVVKPADLDAGAGVACDLRDAAALRRAYAAARALSAHIVVEAHIPGRDYRLGVIDGRLAWVTARVPAGVVGDGLATVEALVSRVNRDPQRSTQPWTRMKPIAFDGEAQDLLAEQGLRPETVPPPGCFVRLRRAANISRGGTATDIPVPQGIHPDNAALAESAARLFRLDMAGIDLITPDIARSWRQEGGAICEINGQPSFSALRPDLPDLVLDGLLPGADGRIPIVVLLAEARWTAWWHALHARLRRAGLVAGIALGDGVQAGDAPGLWPSRSAFADTRALLLDDRIDAVLVATDGLDWARRGLPVDRVDLVVEDGTADPAALRALAAGGGVTRWRVPAPLPGDEATLADPSGWVARLVARLAAATRAQSGVPDRA